MAGVKQRRRLPNIGRKAIGVRAPPHSLPFKPKVVLRLKPFARAESTTNVPCATLCNPQDPKKHNMFFSEDTFEPLVSNAGFKEAVKLHHRFMMSSNCHLGVDNGTDGCVILPAPCHPMG